MPAQYRIVYCVLIYFSVQFETYFHNIPLSTKYVFVVKV
jgi:hypothetical protein